MAQIRISRGVRVAVVVSAFVLYLISIIHQQAQIISAPTRKPIQLQRSNQIYRGEYVHQI